MTVRSTQINYHGDIVWIKYAVKIDGPLTPIFFFSLAEIITVLKDDFNNYKASE